MTAEGKEVVHLVGRVDSEASSGMKQLPIWPDRDLVVVGSEMASGTGVVNLGELAASHQLLGYLV